MKKVDDLKAALESMSAAEVLRCGEELNKIYRHMVANGEATLYAGPARALQDAIDFAKKQKRKGLTFK